MARFCWLGAIQSRSKLSGNGRSASLPHPPPSHRYFDGLHRIIDGLLLAIGSRFHRQRNDVPASHCLDAGLPDFAVNAAVTGVFEAEVAGHGVKAG